jgi:hypothetical protein
MNNIKVELIYQYLKYLNRWDKSASLVSTIQSIENNSLNLTDEQITRLYFIAALEYGDTVHAFKEFGDVDILTIDEFYSKMIIENREEKINYLINE